MGKNMRTWISVVLFVILAICYIYAYKDKKQKESDVYDAMVYYHIRIGNLDNIMKHYIKHPAIDSSGLYYGLDSISYYYGQRRAYQDAIRFLVDTTTK